MGLVVVRALAFSARAADIVFRIEPWFANFADTASIFREIGHDGAAVLRDLSPMCSLPAVQV
jgi:hypothetical protein